MIIGPEILDKLTAEAKASARLRMNFDLRNSAADGSQRLLNAIEPGSVVAVHRHKTTSETMAIMRGRLVVEFYSENGGDGCISGKLLGGDVMRGGLVSLC